MCSIFIKKKKRGEHEGLLNISNRFHAANDATDSHFYFLFVCWNNKVTAAGTGRSKITKKEKKKQPLNDIWSPTAFLLYSL